MATKKKTGKLVRKPAAKKAAAKRGGRKGVTTSAGQKSRGAG